MTQTAYDIQSSLLKAKGVPAYRTELGAFYQASVEEALEASYLKDLEGKIDLIFTSPPFPLLRKKRYGNRSGEDYLNWLSDLAPQLTKLLSPTGSIVVEIGNAWESGTPEMSTLPLEALLRFLKAGDLKLCQQFISHNPARLPGPAQWVNVERIRVKDSFNHVWWMSKNPRAKADNRRILKPYSSRMLELLRNKKYNSGKRPSGHDINAESFFVDHGGAIPPNVLEFSNTRWDINYIQHCKDLGIKPHPARMQNELVEFFIKFLTEENDLVFDPFGGSNTTGYVAEKLRRRWIGIEPVEEYVIGSMGRFDSTLQ